MNTKSENKYLIVADRMEAFCAECESRESDKCSIKEKSCSKFEAEYKNLYFELLYPQHPCRFCIVRPTCNVNGRCEEYRRHQNMRNIANSDLTGEKVDTDFTERYIAELKANPVFGAILETERQYFLYRGE